jgi:hypothetical protein
VNIGISVQTQTAIRDWAGRNGVGSLSEAVRLFIEDCLARDVPKRRLKSGLRRIRHFRHWTKPLRGSRAAESCVAMFDPPDVVRRKQSSHFQ